MFLLLFCLFSFFLLFIKVRTRQKKTPPQASESIKMLSTSSFHATSTGNSDASVSSSSSSSLRASLRSKNLSARAHRARGVRANLFSAHAHREEEFLIRRNANKQKAPSSSLSLRRANRNKKLKSLRTFRLKSEGDDGESRSFSFVRARLYFSSSISFFWKEKKNLSNRGKFFSFSLSLSKGFYPSLFSSVIALNHRRLEGLLFFISIAFFVSIACNTIDPCN